jgi:hypothetical protein
VGLVSVEDPRAGRLTTTAPRAGTELTLAYGRWCARKARSGDCLHLLEESDQLGEDGKRTLALSIALDSVWDETNHAFKDMADPMAVRAAIITSMGVYLTLWLLPEPVSKGLAATLTAALIAYLGVNTVWGLIHGWIQLSDAVKVATTFDAVRAAGERYGEVLGANAARAFVMLATAAIGSTAGLAAKLPTLPGAAQAAQVAAAQGGFRLAAVAQVEAVAVSSEGAFTIALAPGAVAMSALGPGEAPGASVNWKGFSKGSLASHYEKHVKSAGEFGGSISQRDYLRLAKEFAAEQGGGFLEKRVGNFVVKFDPKTRRVFIGHLKEREIRTFYQADGRTSDPFSAAIELATEAGQ